ncbi:MAG: hypothetical protein ACOC83_05365 [Gemmatimonadota bacterium]
MSNRASAVSNLTSAISGRVPAFVAVASALAVLALPTSAHAQACLGNVAGNGQGFASAGASFTDGAWSLNATGGGNTAGPVALQTDVNHTMTDDFDLGITSMSATGAVEIPSDDVSACPVASFGYQWLSDEGDLSGLDVSADGILVSGGMALGADVTGDSDFAFIPRVAASVVHNRATVEALGVSDTESDTYGAFGAGMELGGSAVYGGPSVSVTTQEDSDPVFTVGLGAAF